MPVTPAYTWRQTNNDVTVSVSSVNITKASLDLFVADVFIKVNSPPCLLQLDLEAEVIPEQSRAMIVPAGVDIILKKQVPGLWTELTIPASYPKPARLARRTAAIERANLQREEARARQRELKAADVRRGREDDWEGEWAQRRQKEQDKQEQVAEMLGDLDNWNTAPAQQVQQPHTATTTTSISPVALPSMDDQQDLDIDESQLVVTSHSRVGDTTRSHTHKGAGTDIKQTQRSSSTTSSAAPAVSAADTAASTPQPSAPPLPRVRQRATVTARFTARPPAVDHLPARQVPDRRALAALRAAQRGHNAPSGGVGEGAGMGVSANELESLEVKARGDGLLAEAMALLSAGDDGHSSAAHAATSMGTGARVSAAVTLLRSALDAYAKALQLDAYSAPVLANRAAAHLALAQALGAGGAAGAGVGANAMGAEALLRAAQAPQLQQLCAMPLEPLASASTSTLGSENAASSVLSASVDSASSWPSPSQPLFVPVADMLTVRSLHGRLTLTAHAAATMPTLGTAAMATDAAATDASWPAFASANASDSAPAQAQLWARLSGSGEHLTASPWPQLRTHLTACVADCARALALVRAGLFAPQRRHWFICRLGARKAQALALLGELAVARAEVRRALAMSAAVRAEGRRWDEEERARVERERENTARANSSATLAGDAATAGPDAVSVAASPTQLPGLTADTPAAATPAPFVSCLDAVELWVGKVTALARALASGCARLRSGAVRAWEWAVEGASWEVVGSGAGGVALGGVGAGSMGVEDVEERTNSHWDHAAMSFANTMLRGANADASTVFCGTSTHIATVSPDQLLLAAHCAYMVLVHRPSCPRAHTAYAAIMHALHQLAITAAHPRAIPHAAAPYLAQLAVAHAHHATALQSMQTRDAMLTAFCDKVRGPTVAALRTLLRQDTVRAGAMAKDAAKSVEEPRAGATNENEDEEEEAEVGSEVPEDLLQMPEERFRALVTPPHMLLHRAGTTGTNTGTDMSTGAGAELLEEGEELMDQRGSQMDGMGLQQPVTAAVKTGTTAATKVSADAAVAVRGGGEALASDADAAEAQAAVDSMLASATGRDEARLGADATYEARVDAAVLCLLRGWPAEREGTHLPVVNTHNDTNADDTTHEATTAATPAVPDTAVAIAGATGDARAPDAEDLTLRVYRDVVHAVCTAARNAARAEAVPRSEEEDEDEEEDGDSEEEDIQATQKAAVVGMDLGMSTGSLRCLSPAALLRALPYPWPVCAAAVARVHTAIAAHVLNTVAPTDVNNRDAATLEAENTPVGAISLPPLSLLHVDTLALCDALRALAPLLARARVLSLAFPTALPSLPRHTLSTVLYPPTLLPAQPRTQLFLQQLLLHHALSLPTHTTSSSLPSLPLARATAVAQHASLALTHARTLLTLADEQVRAHTSRQTALARHLCACLHTFTTSATDAATLLQHRRAVAKARAKHLAALAACNAAQRAEAAGAVLEAYTATARAAFAAAQSLTRLAGARAEKRYLLARTSTHTATVSPQWDVRAHAAEVDVAVLALLWLDRAQARAAAPISTPAEATGVAGYGNKEAMTLAARAVSHLQPLLAPLCDTLRECPVDTRNAAVALQVIEIESEVPLPTLAQATVSALVCLGTLEAQAVMTAVKMHQQKPLSKAVAAQLSSVAARAAKNYMYAAEMSVLLHGVDVEEVDVVVAGAERVIRRRKVSLLEKTAVDALVRDANKIREWAVSIGPL